MVEVTIRPETAEDIGDIRDINIAAFRDHPCSQQTEHLMVEALRDAGALEVSLVAEQNRRPVGHIAFSRAVVGDERSGWYLLGPIAVLPELQRHGIGSLLMRAGLDELRVRGALGCVLVGDPRFYGRFGFRGYPGLEYAGVPHEYVLALPLAQTEPCGGITAHEAFEVESE